MIYERLQKIIGCLLAIVLLVSVPGCGRSGNGSTYGESVGYEGNAGLSGYGTLRKLFQLKGYRTFTARTLSRSIDNMQVVVWTPDTRTPPSKVARDFLEEWLKGDGKPKTLVYVGRDHNAPAEYWKQMVEKEPTGAKSDALRQEMLTRLEDVDSDLKKKVFARWFTMDPGQFGEQVKGLRGPWAEGIDVSQTKLWTRTQILPADSASAIDENVTSSNVTTPASNVAVEPSSGRAKWDENELIGLEAQEEAMIPYSEVLLSADDGRPLVFRLTSSRWSSSQIIVVCNGSFLINGGLVPKEHRKLASKLVEQCGQNEKVAFLLSGRNGPYVNDSDDPNYDGKGLEMFTVWPINLIVIHLALLGILFCFAVFPIFGRAGRLKEREKSDFGQHVEAVGSLLARTRNEEFARERISDYFKIVRKESKHPWIVHSPLTTTKKILEQPVVNDAAVVQGNAITAPETIIAEETKS